MRGTTGSEGKLFEFTPEMFGPLYRFIEDDEVTDIDYNGRELWITDTSNVKRKVTDSGITETFIRRFAHRVSDNDSRELNRANPVLENETDTLRISVVDPSVAVSGLSVCIRKSAPFVRFDEKGALDSRFCSREILNLLANCVAAHMNIVVCGQPRAGKTETCKFLSGYIPDHERVITIEDTMEWRYRSLKPAGDCVEMKVSDSFTYRDGIIASLKQNPRWLMIAETRGEEVKDLIQGFSTGVNGMTTLHTDDVGNIPQRMVNMVDDSTMEERFERNVYTFVDVGILVAVVPDGAGGSYRRVEQVGFFSVDGGKKTCAYLVDGGERVSDQLPEGIRKKFLREGIDDVFSSLEVSRRLKRQSCRDEYGGIPRACG
ncbi:MAG: CpaF/VirB11 family protein [Lachnospiraceae bacterium]|nr:CpaF/VirB11 family protein [Lachnospiraceae bacterium]